MSRKWIPIDRPGPKHVGAKVRRVDVDDISTQIIEFELAGFSGDYARTRTVDGCELTLHVAIGQWFVHRSWTPPRMEEPTKLGSVVMASSRLQTARRAFTRYTTDATVTFPWIAERGDVEFWAGLIDPEPYTEDEP